MRSERIGSAAEIPGCMTMFTFINKSIASGVQDGNAGSFAILPCPALGLLSIPPHPLLFAIGTHGTQRFLGKGMSGSGCGLRIFTPNPPPPSPTPTHPHPTTPTTPTPTPTTPTRPPTRTPTPPHPHPHRDMEQETMITGEAHGSPVALERRPEAAVATFSQPPRRSFAPQAFLRSSGRVSVFCSSS